MSDPTSPTAPDAAAPDVLAAVERKALSLLAGTTPGRIDVHRCDADSGAIDYQLQRAPGTPATVLGYATDSDGSSRAKADATLWANAHEMTTAVLTFATEVRRLTATLARLRAPADLAAIGARAAAASPRAVAYSYEGTTRGDPPRHQYSICNGTWQDEDTRPHKCIAMVYSDTEEDTADVVFFVNARHDVLSLLALLAADRERHAAEVAGARAAALREAAAACANLADGYGATDSDAMAFACADAIDALATKGAPDV